MGSAEPIEPPRALATAAQEHSAEAFGVILDIMRTSQSEKMRLLAATLVLDRAGSIGSVVRLRAVEGPEKSADLRARLLQHLKANPWDSFDEKRLKTELSLRSPTTAIRAMLVQLYRAGEIQRTDVGSFHA